MRGLAPQIRGAHASRAAMTASGLTPGGVEALGRFRRHAGSGALRQRRPEADRKRGRVRSPDIRGVGETVWYESATTEWRARRGIAINKVGQRLQPVRKHTKKAFARTLRCQAGRRIHSRQAGGAVPRFRLISKEVVGLGTGAAAPAMAHAILEACGWCYGCLAL